MTKYKKEAKRKQVLALKKKNLKEKLSLAAQAPGNGSQGSLHHPLLVRQERSTVQGRVKEAEERPKGSENETSTPPNFLRPEVNLEFAL